MPVRHDYDAERELWDAYAASAVRDAGDVAEPGFRWTQYEGHGPGVELLGDPGSVLEIGCGTGRNLACLARRGVAATGVDLSPVMVAHSSARWGGLGARFVRAEVLEHLAGESATFDAVYSVFGAAWFCAPERLLPLVHARLNEGGRYVFSQPPAIPGAYGPQGMYKGGFAGPARYTYRYSHTAETWAAMLEDAGFAEVRASVLDAPTPGHIGTLLVRGTRR
ncbi:class I SAM-dependent methyltransferase [Streptomyces sedi]|uniref:Class I SAM-dependent methyltransferase n=1 Tax=Streptomyces sedi TaxID=555059 RepID=A0A5C4V496_9ACTN|nr:class I SAM-dependent methyltransferase [Streptomyces sedi]TNM30603.1 class I SAM-dependent methyltransferase [Streptomyces sedi]